MYVLAILIAAPLIVALCAVMVTVLMVADKYIMRKDDPHELHPMPNSRDPDDCEQCAKSGSVQE